MLTAGLNQQDDPYEIHNLMAHPNEETKRLVDRLNAMLLVTKSCAMDTCRDPWQILQAEYGRMNSTEMSITSLAQAMDPTYDSFFASLPVVRIEECLMFQEAGNEAPFLPPESASLGGYYRLPTDRLPESLRLSPIVPYNDEQQGTLEQRHVTLEEIVRGARELTSEELDPNQEHTFRRS